MADWQKIRDEYEQGASLRDIVAQHGSSIATISRVARHDGWIRPIAPPETVKHETPTPHPPVSSVSPMPLDAIHIARTGLKQLAQHLQEAATGEKPLPLASHKLLSDSLAQYVKVLITAPSETETQDGLVIPLNTISPRTRMAIQRLLAEDEQEKVS